MKKSFCFNLRIGIAVLLSIVFSTLLTTESFSQQSIYQKRMWHWYFGNYGSLDFSSGTPVPVTNSPMAASEGSASISDTSGNLLFYTNGNVVYDKTNLVMSNGTGLKGSSISAQSSIIVPAPGSQTIYYIFTINNWTDPTTELNYNLVDMTLNGGNGQVTVKNTLMNSNVREQVTAVYHSNGIDIWIITHEANSTNYLAYLVTASGVSTSPVVSSTGMLYDGFNRYGYLKASHHGNKLVSTLGGPSAGNETVQLLDFNNATGVVSNPLTLATFSDMPNAYCSEFSPNDSLVYVVDFNNIYINQFNLAQSNIVSSKVNVATGTKLKSALQLGPDNKIYIVQNGQYWLGTIDFPNVPGVGCIYTDYAVSIVPGTCTIGLPNFYAPYGPLSNPMVLLSCTDTSFCEKQCIDFTDLSTNNPTSWQWHFQGGVPDTSTLQNPVNICYNNYGSFDVTLIACNATDCDTLFLPGFINEYANPADSIWQSNDTLFSLPAVSYQWYELNTGLIPGATLQYYITNQPGNYFCLITDSIGCIGSSNNLVIAGLEVFQNNEGDGFSIFPNPSTGSEINLEINILQNNPILFSVFDISGKCVFEKNVLPNSVNKISISLPKLKTGIDRKSTRLNSSHRT